jgi:hypothetical protein
MSTYQGYKAKEERAKRGKALWKTLTWLRTRMLCPVVQKYIDQTFEELEALAKEKHNDNYSYQSKRIH